MKENPEASRRSGLVWLRLAVAPASIGVITWIYVSLIPANALTAGFSYLIAILFIATNWGLVEASAASITAVLCFNFYFLPPIGTFTIADPQNWVALLAFMVTSIVGSQLANKARQRAAEAVERQREMGRLYALSRSILLSGGGSDFAQQTARQIEQIFQFSAVALYDPDAGKIHRAGPADLSEMDDKLLKASTDGASYIDDGVSVSPIRLGRQPIGSLAIRGAGLSVEATAALCNLVAIGLETARGQELSARAEAARQSDEIKSTLFDAIAHEFKTPLTSIKAATSSLLSSEDSKPDVRRELVTIVDEEADRLSALVSEAIQMARIEAGGVRLDRKTVAVRELVHGALEPLASALDGRQVSLDIADDVREVRVDEDLIEMALRHLIDNAAKYSKPNSRLAISARLADGQGTVISVADEGPGIPPHEQDRIFEKFYRSTQTRQRVPGTGMGLAIARAIVRLHKGDISVKSSPETGTEFQVSIPMPAAEPGA